MARVTKTDAEWREQLTSEQYYVCREHGTERPFTGRYFDCHEDGQYHCVCCGASLFASDNKCDSGTGWPSFWAPVSREAVSARTDTSYGMVRTEVLCSQCDAHLGHVFNDGPRPAGLRFCINSAALKLEHRAKDKV